MTYGEPYNMVQRTIERSEQTSMVPNINLYGKFMLPKGRVLEASVNGSYTQTDYERNYSENEFQSYTSADEDFYKLAADIRFVLPFKHKNMLTAKLNHFHTVSMANYAGDYNYWQHLWTAETIFFAEYVQQLNDRFLLMLTPGVSSLQYRLHGDRLISRYSPRVRAGFRYLLAKQHQLVFQFAIDNTYPQLSTINRTDQTIDALRIRRGNPDMGNTNLYNVMLMYSMQAGQFNLTAGVQGLYDNNAVVEHYYMEGDKMICSFLDGAASYYMGGMVSAAWKASENFRLKWDLFVKREILTGSASATQNGMRSSLQIDYYWKNLAVSLRGVTPYRGLANRYSMVHVKYPATYDATVSWTQKNLRIEAGTHCPFTRHNYQEYKLNMDVYDAYQKIGDVFCNKLLM